MKLIIASFPLITIAAAQHLGASLPIKPVTILVALSTFATAIIILRFLYTLFFPNK